MNQMDRHTAERLGQETVSILRSGGYTAASGRYVDLSAALHACRAATIEYPPSRQSPLPAAGFANTQISVENDTVLAVGRRMAAGGAVAALNFAAATSPGGGFLFGARAQEESIARSSGLFLSLEERDMYAFHRVRHDAMYTDYVIYSPSVPVFRTDAGVLLEEPWALSIVTCPAVNGVELAQHAPGRLADVPGVMTARTAKVLSVAAEQNVRGFILGAWGCGAFGLDSEMMARIFRDALAGPFHGVFDEIVFAVTDWSPEQRFIGPFQRTFGGGAR
ncbi:MAG: TIGR02452 family protein [Vicinamibacterales bacterium]